MSYFSPNTNIEEKRQILFKAMDFDADQKLSFNDLVLYYSRVAFANKPVGVAAESEEYTGIYPYEQLTEMVKQIISGYDADEDGMLDYREYCNAITDCDVKEFIDIYFV